MAKVEWACAYGDLRLQLKGVVQNPRDDGFMELIRNVGHMLFVLPFSFLFASRFAYLMEMDG